jgi:hypothetical protein
MFTRFRFWLAEKLCPEIFSQEEFYFDELSKSNAALEAAEDQLRDCAENMRYR